jgi:hypothetical protein
MRFLTFLLMFLRCILALCFSANKFAVTGANEFANTFKKGSKIAFILRGPFFY